MFRREIKSKHSSQLKSSDRKKLFSNILSSFRNLSEDQLLASFPAKESVLQLKISTYQEDSLKIYACRGLPLIIILSDKIIPTIYFLWRHPNIVGSFTISSYVMEKLSKGADLMVPGVIIYLSVPGSAERFRKGDVISLNLPDNKASVGVGLALMSYEEYNKSGGRGKLVNVLHLINDKLFKLTRKKVKIPSFSLLLESRYESKESELLELIGTVDEGIENEDEPKCCIPPNDVLMNAFVISLREHGEDMPLPILTNVFYKNYILDCIPPVIKFDIKKTTYKKLSKFLAKMESEGVIKLETSEKNVQSIVEVFFKHPLITKHVDVFPPLTKLNLPCEETNTGLKIIEGFVVNSETSLLFSKMGYNKGHHLSTQEVKKIVTEYIKQENLKDFDKRGYIVMNPVLTKVIQAPNQSVEWKWLMDKLFSTMGKYYEIQKGGVIIRTGKGKIPIIEISSQIKTGNKKVTVVDNLEEYGIEISEISKECQHALAASTAINKLAGKKYVQFQVQGSHIPYLRKLLMENYCIPKKYIHEGH